MEVTYQISAPSRPKQQALTKFRVICATREPEERFRDTHLGRSPILFGDPFIELRLFASNSIGLPKLYNTAIREARSDPAMLVFIHDDAMLADLFWPLQVRRGLEAFDVIGLAGNKRRLPQQPSWAFQDTRGTWDDRKHLSGIVAHGSNWPPPNVSIFGPPCQGVKLLDGVLLACRSETLLTKELFFDERFDFHFYDMDFCRQAELKGLRLGTWSISVLHASEGNYQTEGWWDGYAKYLAKWGT